MRISHVMLLPHHLVFIRHFLKVVVEVEVRSYGSTCVVGYGSTCIVPV